MKYVTVQHKKKILMKRKCDESDVKEHTIKLIFNVLNTPMKNVFVTYKLRK